MNVTTEKTVRELALENPAATGFLKSWASTIVVAAINLWNKPAARSICR